MKVTINGTVVDDPSKLSPELRAVYDQALASVGAELRTAALNGEVLRTEIKVGARELHDGSAVLPPTAGEALPQWRSSNSTAGWLFVLTLATAAAYFWYR